MLGAERAQRRRLGVAAPVGERAARREAAALGLMVGAGHRALDGRQPLALAVEPRDRAQQAERVGLLRLGEQRIDRRSFDDLAGVHHQHVVGHLGDHAEIVGDDQDRHAEPALQFLQQVEDLRLDGDVERRGRLVGDQELGLAGQRHGDHHALAHAARQAMRIVVDPLGATGCAPARACRWRASRRLRPEDRVRQHRLGDLIADRVDRVERGHRLLEDHRDRGSAHRRRSSAERPRGRGRRTARRPPRPRRAAATRPITESEVTLLPQPDSPTSPTVLPRPTEK